MHTRTLPAVDWLFFSLLLMDSAGFTAALYITAHTSSAYAQTTRYDLGKKQKRQKTELMNIR